MSRTSSIVVGLTLAASVVGAAPFTENFTGGSSPYFSFLQYGGSTITSAVADGAGSDGRVVNLTLPAFPAAGPGGGPNLQSTQINGFGTYEARLKTADCSSQPSTGIITGFFTYLNDGGDQNGNGLRDNSEIDFEWLCAEPQVIWITQWTDYQESPTLGMRRIMRELNLATGQIRQTCYSEGFGACTQNLTGNANEGQPASIAPISGYNSATAYYTYGFTWASNRLTWYVYHPTTGAKIILWDYRGPTSRITQRPAYLMFNEWHTNNWPPPGMPGAIQQPNTPRNVRIDWAKYTTGTTATPTPTPSGGQTVANGTYRIIARHSGKALDVANAATADGSNVHQWDYVGGSNQKWNVTHLGGGQYQIMSVSANKSLDSAGAGTADGTNVQIWTYVGANQQKWTITSLGSGYYRVSPVHAPGLALDVSGVSTANGANVHLWSYVGGTNQQWQFLAP